MRIINCLMQTF